MGINEQNIKSKLEKMVCEDCGKSPEVHITGGKINISCCCEPFRVKVTSRMDALLKAEISSELKNIGRRVTKK